MKNSRCLSWVMIAVLLLSSGCASKYGEQKTKVDYYPACYRPIEDLRKSEHGNVVATVGGAIVGGVLGFMGGAIVGAISTRKADGIIIGALAGAVAGGMLGSVYMNHSKIEEDNKRLYTYLESIDGDISGMDVVTAAATSSLQCYDREFNALVVAMRQKKIDRDAAAKRFAEISSGREEAINILGEVSKNARDLNNEYAEALQKEEDIVLNPKEPEARSASSEDYKKYHARRQNRERNTAAIQRAREKNESLIRKADSLTDIQKSAEAQGEKQTEEINRIMADLAEIRA